METKARTLQERFGFKDDELSTPKHDEIMLWLDENVERLLPSGAGCAWNPAEIDSITQKAGGISKQHWEESKKEARQSSNLKSLRQYGIGLSKKKGYQGAQKRGFQMWKYPASETTWTTR